ncbi:hypothetical protein BOX15_Mlig017917g4 [Macrostomum lignano]|uniref:cyclin-dependent kinase n=2 Tax=Macrostomum lignano TaxID=282301 RepID=A0A267E1V1_9PLAT|nr:hypothetical protein BOX15_Mlig017917g4 [Macrostomum lignano]
MEKYDNLGLVGEGSYGMVMKCRRRDTGQLVAIKKFLDSEDDKTVKKIALREIKMLKTLRHDNLVNLLEVFRRKKRLYLVFEYIDYTVLDHLEKYPRGIDEMTTRRVLFQVIRGIEYCHKSNTIHRDVKPENILVSKDGIVKICDFGFARSATGDQLTDYVATRWYRAPELLVGDPRYGKPIDIWAIGCLAAEMLTGEPLFPGDSDIDQLFHIVRCLGNLPPRYRDIFHKNPLFVGMRVPEAKSIEPLERKLPKCNKVAVEMMRSCLLMEADDRPSCTELLEHDFFQLNDFAQRFLAELESKFAKTDASAGNGSGVASGSGAAAKSKRPAQQQQQQQQPKQQSLSTDTSSTRHKASELAPAEPAQEKPTEELVDGPSHHQQQQANQTESAASGGNQNSSGKVMPPISQHSQMTSHSFPNDTESSVWSGSGGVGLAVHNVAPAFSPGVGGAGHAGLRTNDSKSKKPTNFYKKSTALQGTYSPEKLTGVGASGGGGASTGIYGYSYANAGQKKKFQSSDSSATAAAATATAATAGFGPGIPGKGNSSLLLHSRGLGDAGNISLPEVRGAGAEIHQSSKTGMYNSKPRKDFWQSSFPRR